MKNEILFLLSALLQVETLKSTWLGKLSCVFRNMDVKIL